MRSRQKRTIFIEIDIGCRIERQIKIDIAHQKKVFKSPEEAQVAIYEDKFEKHKHVA